MTARTNTVVPIRIAERRGAEPEAPVVAIAGVGKTFDSRRGQVRALDAIDLSVRNKEFVCILGPSGCGKSTILGLIAGLTQPSEGSVSVNGRSIATARKEHRIGLVFQEPTLDSYLTASRTCGPCRPVRHAQGAAGRQDETRP